jgi:hypothetical protein
VVIKENKQPAEVETNLLHGIVSAVLYYRHRVLSLTGTPQDMSHRWDLIVLELIRDKDCIRQGGVGRSSGVPLDTTGAKRVDVIDHGRGQQEASGRRTSSGERRPGTRSLARRTAV